MSNIFCPCAGSGSGNTGLTAKRYLQKVTRKLIAVRLYADDGTRNSIADTDTIDQAYIDAKINHSDASKRWYPIGEFVNVDRPTPDDLSETFNDGSSAITGQNPRTFTGFLLNTPPLYIAQLEALLCNPIGFYFVDACGSPQGEINSANNLLYPIAINNQSFSAKAVNATDTAVFKIQVTFEIKQSVKDSNLRQIKESVLSANSVDFLDLEGLIDVTATAPTSITTTGFVTTLSADAGGFIEQTAVEGFTDADFALYNNTSDAAVVITSVTESPAGTYTFVIPAQTSSDNLTLSSAVSGDAFVKTGFEITAVSFDIP